MTISLLPLSYCTNVHPGRSLAEVDAGLDEFTVPLRANLEAPLAAGLWLAQPVIRELLESPETRRRFADRLASRELFCHTLNAFPYGDFHSPRVKETVYIPDWSDPKRLEYTRNCATVLAALLPPAVEGSISTVPLGFKEFSHPADFCDRAMSQLIELAESLSRLFEQTGKTIRLAVEPEPFCLLETTAEAITFFERLFQRAAEVDRLDVVRNYIGLCYDVCHQAVEFEDVAESIGRLDQAGVRINKVHITCAVELEAPRANVEGREALARYVEPRYLHQTMARTANGDILRAVDLTDEIALDPPAEFLEAPVWRVHFHVPVDADRLGPLATTRGELKTALRAVAALADAPHLEVETYTWEVLPDGGQTNLVDGLTRELTATRQLLAAL